MNLAEQHTNAIVGLYHTLIPLTPRGVFYYYFFALKPGNNCTPVARAAACSYRLPLLNTVII